jgi:hypothetical protein
VPRLEGLEGRYAPATVTSLADSGAGSLRQAILDTPAGGTVEFQPGLAGTITLTTGQLTLARNVSILGPGADIITVSGNNASRVFEVTPAATVTITGLTIRNGRAIGAPGGGIANAGTLTVTASTLSGNSASEAGGIYNSSGTLTVIASTLSGNSAPSGGGGGISNFGSGTVAVTASTLSGNSASSWGGGIANYSPGTLSVTASTLSGNSAGGIGGGILNAGTLTVTASTLSGNTTSTGGGIFNDGTLTLTNSTLSGNAVASWGGGIYNAFSAALLTVTSSTLSDNSAGDIGGGIFVNPGTLATVRNAILAGNTAPSSPDVSGLLNSLGYNLIGVGDGGSGYHPTDLVGTAASPLDPLLEPLGDYGGPTQTMRPRPASPAVDAGLHFNTVLTDQRGFPRHVDAFADIGAVELQPGERTILGGAVPGGLADLLFALPALEERNAGGKGYAGRAR